MVQLKINKSVGKKVDTDPADVLLVQTCLSTIKVKSHALATCEAIKKAPLPKEEGEALSKIVKDSAAIGVPLSLKSVDIDSSGHFVVHMDIPDFILSNTSSKTAIKKSLAIKISEFVDKYGAWKADTKETLTYCSTNKNQRSRIFNGAKLHAVSNLKTSAQGVNFIKMKEGTSIIKNAHILYDDIDNNCTIGYGTLVHSGKCDGKHVLEKPYLNGIDDNTAMDLLDRRIKIAENDVRALLADSFLTQAMFDAYVSLLYNIGKTNAKKDWKVFQYSRKGLYGRAAPEFLDINKSGGMPIKGLTNRRRAEHDLFLWGKY